MRTFVGSELLVLALELHGPLALVLELVPDGQEFLQLAQQLAALLQLRALPLHFAPPLVVEEVLLVALEHGVLIVVHGTVAARADVVVVGALRLLGAADQPVVVGRPALEHDQVRLRLLGVRFHRLHGVLERLQRDLQRRLGHEVVEQLLDAGNACLQLLHAGGHGLRSVPVLVAQRLHCGQVLLRGVHLPLLLLPRRLPAIA